MNPARFLLLCCLTFLFPLLLMACTTTIVNETVVNETDASNASNEVFSEAVDLLAFSHTGGFYTDTFQLELSTTQETAEIYYTVDGSEPTTASLRYVGPISVTSRAGDPNVLSLIPTTIPDLALWQEPTEEIFKATILRARLIRNNGELDPVITHTYFVDPLGADRYSLPVVSVVSDAANFFDPDIGIYVPGNSYDGDDSESANYAQGGRSWERPVHIELFANDGMRSLAQDAGVRIHGSHTARFQSKSLRFYARSDYGPEAFNIQLFPDQPFTSFDTFILRNAGQDWGYAHFRDALMHRMVDHLSLDVQAFRPVVTFLNGEYWGILNMRERQDANYLKTHYGISTDEVDMLELPDEVSEGSDEHYLAMIEYIETNGLTAPADYAYIQTQMDVDNYIDYNIVEIFSRNTDWPHTNVENWRYQADAFDPNAPDGFDGRWRWFVQDLDHGVGRDRTLPFDRNILEWATSPDGNGSGEWATFLLRALLENETFRHTFINRFADLLNTTFVPERFMGMVDEIAGTLAPEMPEHIRRYKQPGSMESWEEEVAMVRHFAEVRTGFQREHLVDFFDLGGSATVELNVSDSEAGTIAINSLLIDDKTIGITGNPYPWQGIYFQDVPVKITANPHDGYSFVGWEGLDDGQLAGNASVEIFLTEDLKLTAHFEADSD